MLATDRITVVGLQINSTWAWRLPCLFAIVGPIFVILMIATAPESPRFMVRKGKNSQALAMLAKHHANGDTNDALVKWEFEEIQIALEEELAAGKTSYVSCIKRPAQETSRLIPSQLDFFKTPGNRKRLWVSSAISVGINWVGNGIVS